MREEMEELNEAEKSGAPERIEEEVGDLLFTMVNISRFHGIDPEAALRRANDKFVRRFTHVESHLESAKGDLTAMDALWNETKKKEKRREMNPLLIRLLPHLMPAALWVRSRSQTLRPPLSSAS